MRDMIRRALQEPDGPVSMSLECRRADLNKRREGTRGGRYRFRNHLFRKRDESAVKSGREVEKLRSRSRRVTARLTRIEPGTQPTGATPDRAGEAVHQRNIFAQTRSELSRGQHIMQTAIHRDEPAKIALIEHDGVVASATLEMPGAEEHLHSAVELLRLIELGAELAEQRHIRQAILEHELAQHAPIERVVPDHLDRHDFGVAEYRVLIAIKRQRVLVERHVELLVHARVGTNRL